MEKECKDTEPVMIWLLTPPRNNLLGIYKLRHIVDETTQKMGMDLIGTGFFSEITIENKIRTRDWGDLLIETKSKIDQDTWGWIYYSEADYLAYVILQENKINGSILKMQELKEWWKTQNPEDYPFKIADNGWYKTGNRAVPYKKIPKEIYIYSDHLGINSLP